VNGRCGPGTRIPFLVVSPWARGNFVDHAAISQASVVRFIEDNWLDGKRIGNGSFDATAGSITGLFDFGRQQGEPALFLDPKTGEVVQTPPAGSAD
jgi:phospholipase C